MSLAGMTGMDCPSFIRFVYKNKTCKTGQAFVLK